MLELVKDNELINKKQILNQYDNSYRLIEEDTLIGIGALGSKNEENMAFISIKEEYQGNKYGTRFFKLLIDEARKNGFKEIFLTIEQENIKMKRIVEKYDYKYLTKVDGYCKYSINI